MRTLILTCDPAFPPVSGADLRNSQNARAAARLGPVLLASISAIGDACEAAPGIEVAALQRKGEPKGASIVRWRTGIEPRISQAALARLLDLVGEFRPDHVIVEGMPLFALLRHLRPVAPNIILDMHNVELDFAAQAHTGMRRGERASLLPWSQAARIRRRERKALALVDRVWVCSDVDRDRLRSLFATDMPIDVVPNGIPRPESAPAVLPEPAGKHDGWPVMLLIGHLRYAPNVDAAKRLALEILPRVRQSLPDARVILAGRNPGPEIGRLGSLPGVDVVANPQDTGALLARSHVSVVPLSSGGGTRIKIPEAMAWGLPVVATPVAAEGQGFSNGEDIRIEQTDERLAQAVVDLFSSEQRLERLRQLAHERIWLRYGPAAVEQTIRRGLGYDD